jgi:Flp pilus assembly protein CpaB
MDTTTIIVIIVIVVIALLAYLAMQRNRSSGESTVVDEDRTFAGSNDRRTVNIPQTDRPRGQTLPTNARPGDDDAAAEAIDDVKSQNPDKSL